MARSKGMHTDYYVISDDFRLLDFNQNVSDRYPGIRTGDLCYQATMRRGSPCAHCPIAGNGDSFCPVYFDPFYKDWVEAVFAEIGPGKYAVLCHPASPDARRTFQRLKTNGLSGNLLNEYQSEDIGILGSYFAPGFPLYDVNPRMVQMLGYHSREDFETSIQGQVANAIHPEDLARVEREIAEQFHHSEDSIDRVKYRIRRKDGALRLVDDIGRKIFPENGIPVFYACMVDVTDSPQTD